MKMTEDRENELLIIHAPIGIPVVYSSEPSNVTNDSDQVLLINEDYLTAGWNIPHINLSYRNLLYGTNYYRI
jgi:hypothetical protein